MNNTDDLAHALEIIQRVEPLLTAPEQFSAYYGTTGNLYSLSGQDALANHYWQLSVKSANENTDTDANENQYGSLDIDYMSQLMEAE